MRNMKLRDIVLSFRKDFGYKPPSGEKRTEAKNKKNKNKQKKTPKTKTLPAKAALLN